MVETNPRAEKPRTLQGLAVLNSDREMRTGAARSIKLAAPYLKSLGVHLHFAAVRSVAHFLHGIAKTRRLRYDFALFNGLASLSHRSRFGPKLAHTAHALRLPTFLYWHETDWVLDAHRREHPRSAKIVDEIARWPSVTHLVPSTACERSIESHYPGTEPIVIFECTAVPRTFDFPVKPSSPPTVVNLASIQERKGTDLFVETAIKVCQQHPQVEFLWLGHGEPYSKWRQEIVDAGLERRILFPGYVDAGHLILRRASVFFLSSRDDPFPLSNLEAMCLGRSVVCFDVGGAPEALAGHGTVIPPFDTDRAARAILDCLDKPPEQRVNAAVRELYLDRYTPERFAARLNRCIRERLGRNE
jgi:glycosyltransferase involved in cell wall biosynthesis